jgi:hypothetical protein
MHNASPFPSYRSPVPGHSSKHYSLLPTAKLVAASVGDLEMGKSDIFARHSLTDIIASASPSRALQTLEVPSYASASPNNSCGTIAA